MPRATLIQPRAGTAATWTSVNPVLAAGEMGVESDTGRHKYGNGSSTWTSLPYAYPLAALQPTSVQNSAYTANPFDDVVCSPTSPFTGTMPTALTGQQVRWTNILSSGSNAVTLQPATGDIFLPSGSANPFALPGESLYCYCYSNGYWSLI